MATYTADEQALIDIMKANPSSTISEMKMLVGARMKKDVPNVLNMLRVKGLITHTEDNPRKYSLSGTSL